MQRLRLDKVKTFISIGKRALLIFAAIGACIVFLKYFPVPYAFIFLLLIFSYFFLFKNKEVLLLAGSITFGLLIGELTFFAVQEKIFDVASTVKVEAAPARDNDTTQALVQASSTPICPDEERWESAPYMEKGHSIKDYDPVRGYSAFANTAVRRIEKRKCQVVSDVTYTLADLGSRTAKNCGAKKLALFFGCSFMYGEGLNDADTLPYLTQEAAGCDFDALNLAFHGYGPHQMLRMLETGFLDAAVKGKNVTYAFYRVAAFHADRVTGQVPWDRFGPKYEYRPGSGVVYVGTFSPTSEAVIVLQNQVKKSFLFSRALGVFSSRVFSEQEKVELLAEVVAESDRILRQKYGVNLRVLYELHQNNPLSARDQAILDRLRQKGIDVTLSREVYRDLDPDKLVVWDKHHPNRLNNRLWASHIKTTILDHAR